MIIIPPEMFHTNKTNLLMIVASALKFLRSKNISHMDLKPQNMLLSTQDDPVLKLAGTKNIAIS